MSNETIPIPNSWKAGQITKQGLGLLSKLVMGHTLTLIRAECGTGFVPEEELPDLLAVSGAVDHRVSFYPTSDPQNGRCIVACVISNQDLAESFICRQVGIYALDPDEGEILFFISQVAGEDDGTGVPSQTLIPSYTATWNFVVYFSMADGVKVEVDPNGLATFEMMKQYIADTYRPMTDEEIIEAFGAADIIDSEGGIVATTDHARLRNRDLADQHPISAITGLEAALAERVVADEATAADIDDIWDAVYGDQTT